MLLFLPSLLSSSYILSQLSEIVFGLPLLAPPFVFFQSVTTISLRCKIEENYIGRRNRLRRKPWDASSAQENQRRKLSPRNPTSLMIRSHHQQVLIQGNACLSHHQYILIQENVVSIHPLFPIYYFHYKKPILLS